MVGKLQRFQVLYRISLSRLIDLDVLVGGAGAQDLAIRLVSILAGFSFALAFIILPRYVTAAPAQAQLVRLASNDEEFLISTTMAVAGLFAVLAWNAVFPDKRDSFVLGLLPLGTRTLVLAKIAAMLTALGIGIGALNVFTGLIFPFMAVAGTTQQLRSLIAWWLVLLAAGSFALFSVLALQGLASQILPWRMFLRGSSLLQFAALLVTLGLFFLPPAFETVMQFPGTQRHNMAGFLPSFWFTGLFHWLRGDHAPPFAWLAGRAALGLVITVSVASLLYALAYFRNMRRMIETPDISPVSHGRPFTQILTSLAALFKATSVERAILLFSARTIARSRQHRLLLAALTGIGFAVALAFSRSFLQGMLSERWDRPNAAMLNAGTLLLFFAIIGTRAMFVLPVALSANWIFKITAVHSPMAYFAAVRRVLIVLTAAPVWIISAVVYFSIWPAEAAFEHVAVLFLAGALLVDLSLYQFRKIPFACSYLAPEANQRMKAGLYCAVFLAFSSIAAEIELWTMSKPTRFAVFFSILLGLVVWARRRAVEFARSAHTSIQFEDIPVAEVFSLDLAREQAAYGDPLGDARRGKEYEIEEEIESHIRMAIRDRVRGGETAESAGRAVLREFGNRQSVKESMREVWSWATLEQIFQDLHSGIRVLRNSPVFSAAAIALIAVGIGGNTTIFSMIHSILTKAAPGVSASRLAIFGLTDNGRLDQPENSFPNYLDYAASTRTMSSLVATAANRMTVVLRDGTYEMRGEMVTPNYFETLGIHFAKGRAFTAGEASGASGLVAVIAWHVWQNQFHGDDGVLGRALVLNGYPAIVVGVTAEGFHGTQFAPSFEVGVPLVSYLRTAGRVFQLSDRSDRFISIIGRLAPGTSLSEAQAEFTAISKRLQGAFPDANRTKMVVLAPYSATAFGPWQNARTHLFIRILIAVGLLTLLIVCANVANLMLARSVARQREMAVRQSIGGSRVRILRMLLAEALVLSVIASASAFLFAVWVSHAVVKLIPPLESGARLQPNLTPDWSVAGYAMILALVSAFAFTLAPTLRAWRQELLPWLKAGEHGVAQGRSTLASVLVVLQLALCVVLLTGAGLASRSVHLIGSADLHFAKDHLLIVRVNTSGAAATEQDNIVLLERLRERLRGLHGIVSVSYASAVPPSPWGDWAASVRAAGATQSVPVEGMDIGPDYLETLGVRGMAGQQISESDIGSRRSSAVITRHLAEALWRRESGVGRTLLIGRGSVTVVGISPDAAFSGIGPEGNANFVFLPERSGGGGPGMRFFHLRYRGNLQAIGPAVRAAIRQSDERVPVSEMKTMEAELEDYSAPAILVAALLGCFSTGSLIVAALGLYAVIAFHTARRTRDFGIRMAVGASSRRILREVLGEGLLLAAIGCTIGLALSLAAGRAFHSFLFGVSPADGVTYLGVAGMLAVISLFACYVPARRAARINPMDALREE